MQTIITRRQFIKGTFGALLTSFGVTSGGYIYANQIEPTLLDIKEIPISHPLIPKSFNGLKIIQFSDIHLGFQYTLRQLKRLVKQLNSLQPDIVLFTGDLMDDPKNFKESDKISPILKEIHATKGKFCIYGNHDHGGYGSSLYKQIMKDSDFTLLLNEAKPIKQTDGSSIYLIGIDDAMLGMPDLALAIEKLPKNAFTILLSHEPDLADHVSSYNINWQLSGHSHGGQVKIPFIGPLIIPPFARKYPEGHYTIGKTLNLYVNRGIGTTRLPFRFMAKPELTIFSLKSSV
ncbi:MAG: metallophosphoesterase [Bacillota bacterium]|nr:metallophosphoesterase [Bacillota bacterium]